MNTSKASKLIGTRMLTLCTALIASPWTASACSVCYGEPDSPASKGLTWAISLLAIVVVGVMAGIVSFFVAANKNTAALSNPPSRKN